jgi:E3 ubiquitin-protein ligase RNF1/2
MHPSASRKLTASGRAHSPRSGRECPVCRAHIPTRRHLRDDPDFDAVVTALYAGAGDYDAR